MFQIATLHGESIQIIDRTDNSIIKIEIVFQFSLFDNKHVLKDKFIIVDDKKEIKDIVENMKFHKKISHLDSAMKRKPDVVLNIYGDKQLYCVSIWDDGKCFKYVSLKNQNRVRYYGEVSEKFQKVLLMYYNRVLNLK